jgi:ketosteroid isomerase-like protein
VLEIIEKYENAWTERNPEAIIKIFKKNGIYHERVLEKPFVGHSQIKKYWKDKVIGEQENIKFKLLHLYIDGDTAIAEWEVKFYDKIDKNKVHMKEIAVLNIKGNKIQSLREYWSSKHVKN